MGRGDSYFLCCIYSSEFRDADLYGMVSYIEFIIVLLRLVDILKLNQARVHIIDYIQIFAAIKQLSMHRVTGKAIRRYYLHIYRNACVY